MQADGQHALPFSTGAGPEAALARCLAPAWVIDPAMGRVMAANAAGAARLGLRPDAASGTLDAAMPGLVRLRALMHEPLNGGRREPLIFWTAYGAESLLCNVSALAEPASPPLVLVSIVGAEEEMGASRLPAPPKAIAPPSPDDAATMQKIARAIRTGFAKSKEEVTPDPDDDAETAPGTGMVAAREPTRALTPQPPDVSKLAHELKTPLSAIVLAAEIMKDQRFGALANERYQSYSSDIHDNARHALEVINRLLADSAPEDKAARLEAAELDLNAIAESCVSGMRPLAEKAELELGQELHSRLPRVVADAMSVKQVLYNLLANAIKFTKAEGEVRVVTGLGFDRSVFVAVQDTGPGMTADEIARALDTETPPRPERKEAGGLGIGLPLASSLAKANGARIEIDSTPGEGTVVALVFPKDRVAAQRALPPPPKSSN
jgi:two-component system, cell cycle sensor histidine kinase PleC